ncbi:gluconate 2-dehydrogenase subunit 3 family protein [Flagellimonas sp. S3867]|uniref:gluconate 2-dehydrogenase subunit 3 family protein n=1 Tax=Flagellimonas sp. S3867 TaxID=2768063 RepID=UPI0016878AEF|nr:gluconate 2-dehydrogenase subunit 3 family protein [Flagellimonas sp. S3867]
MERRVALKNMGMVFGYAVATPTLLSIAQSCKNKKVLDWAPSFFSKEQGGVIHSLVDILLPKTDTPSASELNVHMFIDQFAHEVLPEEQQAVMKLTMEKFTNKVLASSGKEHLADLDDEDLEPVFASYLKKRAPEQEEEHGEIMEAYIEAIENGETAELDDEVASYAFANNVRDSTIWAYKSSEYIGEEVLAYLPIPGEYIACGDVNELTQGRAWSL